MDCQARHKRQLDFAFNASFASLNAAKVFMKDNGMDNSMAKVKSLMFNANYTKLIFDMSRFRPNRTLISKIVKELIGWQPKAAQPYTQILTNYCLKIQAIYKAFALTGRLADCYYTQGDALGQELLGLQPVLEPLAKLQYVIYNNEKTTFFPRPLSS